MKNLVFWCFKEDHALHQYLRNHVSNLQGHIIARGIAKELTCSHLTYKQEQPNFVQLNENSVLYIHVHGSKRNETEAHLDAPKIYKNKKVRISAEEFASYLYACNLPKSLKVIKLAACYSANFAKHLQFNLEKMGYTAVSVYGYKGKYCLGAGNDSQNLAGFEDEHVTKTKLGNMLNYPAIAQKGLNYFKALNHSVCYGPMANMAKAKAAESKAAAIKESTLNESNNNYHPMQRRSANTSL